MSWAKRESTYRALYILVPGCNLRQIIRKVTIHWWKWNTKLAWWRGEEVEGAVRGCRCMHLHLLTLIRFSVIVPLTLLGRFQRPYHCYLHSHFPISPFMKISLFMKEHHRILRIVMAVAWMRTELQALVGSIQLWLPFPRLHHHLSAVSSKRNVFVWTVPSELYIHPTLLFSVSN